MRFEDPARLLGRLRLGREEFCQRLLTMLIVGGEYPRWNSRNTPTEAGADFLRAVDRSSFGVDRWRDPAVFVDEFELPPRHDDERGGAPDYALLWPDRLWLIELKTEPASHRVDQLPSYFTLAAHHYPQAPVDITYLTPTMQSSPPVLRDGQRYAHLTWPDVAPLVRDRWATSADPAEATVCRGLLAVIDAMESTPTSQWRTDLLTRLVKAAPRGPEPTRAPAPHRSPRSSPTRPTTTPSRQRWRWPG